MHTTWYIHTCLNDITNKIFNKVDEALLDYINDDGFIVEPNFTFQLFQ